MRNMGKNMRGFTLIEIMVVVAIIGIMAVIAIPNFTTLTPHQQLMLTLKSLAGMINEGKARALFTQNQHNVIIDIANRRISLVDTITGEVIDLFNFPGSVTIGPIQGWGMSLTFPFNALPNNTMCNFCDATNGIISIDPGGEISYNPVVSPAGGVVVFMARGIGQKGIIFTLNTGIVRIMGPVPCASTDTC